MIRKGFTNLILAVVLMLLVLAFSGLAHGQTVDGAVVPESTSVQTPAGTLESRLEEASTVIETPQAESDASEQGGILDAAVPTRTPVPTATPSAIQDAVSEVAEAIGLDEVIFLGLSGDNWIDLIISLLIIAGGYFLGTWVIRRLLPRLVRRTATDFDDQLLSVVGPDIRWLVFVFVLQFAVDRLLFINDHFNALFRDFTFIVEVVIVLRILWRLLEFAENWFNQLANQQDREQELTPVVKLLVIIGKFLILLFGLTVLLSHFGIDVTLFIAALGIGGLALSLGARDLMSDLIAGITILVDRPFRIGDRIDVDAAEAWGDVIDIGLRTTRIRTLDNRLVIVPNSVIAKNEVINYSFPDPTYRYQTSVGVAYGTDIETARQIILDAVRQIDAVLQDRPVEALYKEMGDSSIVFTVRWWMGSYTDTRNLEDQVLTQIHAAFNAAGIEIPFPQQDVHLDVTADTVEQISQVTKE